MTQINNNFKDCYYIDDNFNVINTQNNKIIKLDCSNSYRLQTIDNKTRKISQTKLLKMVFGKSFVLTDVETLPGEEWREIEEDSFYFISSFGRVKSTQTLTAKILKTENHNGYERIKLSINGISRHYLIHRLVAIKFLEPPKNPFQEVHHINFEKSQNFFYNLMWVDKNKHYELHKEHRRLKSNEE